MTRPPVGNLPQPQAASAVAAHIACRLAGVGSDRARRDAWLRDELQVKLRSNGLNRAAAQIRGILLPWSLVDESLLPFDLEKALVVFPGSGRSRPRLLAFLRGTGALRQLIVTRSRRDVVCVLLYRHAEQDTLFASIDAFGEPFAWESVIEENRSAEAGAWATIAKRIAHDESLLSE